MQALLRAVALLAIGLVVGGAVGYTLGHQVAQAEQADIQLNAATAALTRERQARAAADQVMAHLATEQATNARLTQERNDALHAATTGRRCLDGRALRVLDGAPGIRVAELPASAASGADAQGGSAAAAAGQEDLTSTDADVGAWILGAGLAYESCRARLNGLIDYLSTPPLQLHAKDAP